MGSVLHAVSPALQPAHGLITQIRGYYQRLNALLRLGFPEAVVRKTFAVPQTVTRRIIMQKARCHTFHKWYSAPTACKYMVSDSISLP